MSIDFGTDIYEEPIVAKTFLSEDAQEGSLRPKTLREYIGQEKAKGNLAVFIEAAKRRNEPLDHVLLHGPPGLGKTTLAGIIAAEMGVNIRITSGPAIEKAGDLAALLTNLSENDILFVDEIHRLNRAVEEILYPAMEDYAIDIIIGKGPSANSIRLDLPHFTLIGATTRAGQLSAPLRDRFGVTLRLELYTPGGACEDRHALGRHPERFHRPRGRDGDRRAARAARRASPTGCSAACAILPQVQGRRRHHARGGGRGAARAGDRPARPRPHRPPDAARHHRELRRRPGRPGHARRDHRRGVRHARRTCTSRTCMQLGFLTRTPRGRCVTRKAYEHLGLSVPASLADEAEQLSLN